MIDKSPWKYEAYFQGLLFLKETGRIFLIDPANKGSYFEIFFQKGSQFVSGGFGLVAVDGLEAVEGEEDIGAVWGDFSKFALSPDPAAGLDLVSADVEDFIGVDDFRLRCSKGNELVVFLAEPNLKVGLRGVEIMGA